jgi:hypothetical protein
MRPSATNEFRRASQERSFAKRIQHGIVTVIRDPQKSFFDTVGNQ